MPPAWRHRARNLDIAAQLWVWNQRTGLKRSLLTQPNLLCPMELSALRCSLDSQGAGKRDPSAEPFCLPLPGWCGVAFPQRPLAVRKRKCWNMKLGARLGWLIDPLVLTGLYLSPRLRAGSIDDPEIPVIQSCRASFWSGWYMPRERNQTNFEVNELKKYFPSGALRVAEPKLQRLSGGRQVVACFGLEQGGEPLTA